MNLAFEGPRSEWAQQQQAGASAITNISVDAVANSGDTLIAALAELHQHEAVATLLRQKHG